MAVFLRTPQQYLGLLEHACARGGVPVYFDRGTRRPDPAGRAFVALLSCGVDGLSAKRFDEYLSLGQVPVRLAALDARGRNRVAATLADGARDEVFDRSNAEPARLMTPSTRSPSLRLPTLTKKRSLPARCARRGSGRS